MTMVTPDYYHNFKCIADKCKHSCCIGWEIDIDDETLEKYDNQSGEFACLLNANIEFDETPHFKLGKDERCPFLNKNGLCDIITNLGEDMLCQICSDHPRFRNYYDNFIEIGLGLTCEAAAEIILTNKEKVTLNLPDAALKLPIIKFRENLFDVLQDREFCVDERIENMLSLVSAQLPDNVNWFEVFYGLEKLDSAWNGYLSRIKNGISYPSKNTSLELAYEQLVVYLVFRHFTDCQYDNMIKERVLFVALIYKIIRAMNSSNTIDELLEIARLYSSEIEYSDENINTLLETLQN